MRTELGKIEKAEVELAEGYMFGLVRRFSLSGVRLASETATK